MDIKTLQGDITTVAVDAIVNAANSSLMGGGGVDGAIHRAAGPRLLAECAAIRDRQGPCPTGNVVVTGAGELKAKIVLHAVGPIWQGGGRGEEAQLASCYRNALKLAARAGCRSIAFPAISTGIFGYPPELAVQCVARVMEEARKDTELQDLETVLFVLFGEEQARLYEAHFLPSQAKSAQVMSKAHAFLAGIGRDARGRSLEQVLSFDDRELESVHDYIQWLFPLDEPSRFNPDAPLLDASTIAAIHNDPKALEGLHEAVVRMLAFYEVRDHWARAYDHNLLRITRIIGSCRHLLGDEAARTVLARIRRRCAELGFDPGAETLGYWERAARAA